MGLDDIWFGLFVVIIAGYLILDGFDLGVGILHPFVAKTDEERRISLNSIGPIWDGNEVWLVLGGGVLFAGFPPVYSALLSGFYGAFMVFLLVIILRTVSIEFRGQRASARWRKRWDWVFSIASFTVALILGVAFGNIVRGVPIDKQGEIQLGSLVDLLDPYALWLGATTVAMLALHGALYLNLKTQGDMEDRVRNWIPKLMMTFFLMAIGALLFIVLETPDEVSVYSDVWTLVFPIGAGGAFLFEVYEFRQGRDGRAFFASAATIAFLLFSVAAGLFPNLLISSTDAKYNLNLSNSAAANNTLQVMLIFALIGMPFVLLYTAGVQYLFRGKVQLSQDSY
jgi:cytochrome d ubiquinol oxidase subunit II